jgi:hypothetical protein
MSKIIGTTTTTTTEDSNNVQKEIVFIPDKECPNRIDQCQRDFSRLTLSCVVPKREKPHQTWYYSSNHVLVNRERMMRGIAPLMRVVALDELARSMAMTAASMDTKPSHESSLSFRSNYVTNGASLDDLIESPCEGNLLHGSSIRSIHNMVMRHKCKEKDRILRENFQQFGVATYKGEDGVLFLCQLFRKTGRIEL